MADIMHRVRIAAPIGAVYAAIATQDGVRAWWTKDTVLADAVGGEGEFAFHGRKVVTRVRIETMEPPRKVVWKTLSSNAPGDWAGSTISFELTAEGDVTRVAFAHRGFPSADEGYAQVTSGWGFYLTSLRQYLETGRGVPNPEDGTLRIV